MLLTVTTALVLVLLDFSFGASCIIDGEVWTERGDYCYLFLSKDKFRMSYYEAESYCRYYEAHLVSIHSESENEFILKSMEEQGTGGRAWIGFNLLDGEDTPKWSDGTTVSYQKRVKKEFPQGEKCFMMYLSQRGWRPEHCALHYPPICKIRKEVLPPQTGYCPNEWIQFGQKCYKYFGASEQDRLKYVEARNACQNLGEGSSLVSIHSMEEQAFLTQHLSDLGTSAWIGINKVESDEIGHDIVFGWVDNSWNNFSYWARGHPPPGTWKYCGMLTYDGVNKGEWVADYCDLHKRGYICQRKTDLNLPEPTPQRSKCRKGFQGYKNSCYRYIDQTQTQENAERTCKDLGGHLVSIVDSLEQSFLYNFVKNEATDYVVGIGLENIQGTRFLRWIDKQPLHFSNWAEGQPSFNVQDKSCAIMVLYDHFKWNMTECSRKIPHVCKTTADISPEVPEILGNCPSGESSWLDIGNEYCYHIPISNPVLSWDDTSRYCISRGMKMVSLHSDHETKSLVAYLQRETLPVHLGLIRTFDKKSFVWIDGTPMNYTNWENGEPSSWSSSKNCAAFSPTEGKWIPINCSDRGIALCQAKKN